MVIPVDFKFWPDKRQEEESRDPSEESAESETFHFKIHKSWSQI